MVKYPDAGLARTFAALADPTRRALLARLEQETELSVSELAKPFPVSLPAVMKHLDVLSEAGLITRAKAGRTVSVRLNAGPMEQAMEWRSEEHTSELQSLMRISYAVFCLKKKKKIRKTSTNNSIQTSRL